MCNLFGQIAILARSERYKHIVYQSRGGRRERTFQRGASFGEKDPGNPAIGSIFFPLHEPVAFHGIQPHGPISVVPSPSSSQRQHKIPQCNGVSP